MIDKQSVENARVAYYSLFSKLFVFSYDKDRFCGVKGVIDMMLQAPLDELSEFALKELSIDFEDENRVISEYDAVFHAPPKPLRTTISFYDEGYESGVACLRVKNLLAKTKFRRDEIKYKDQEDNFGFLFALMSEFITLQIKGEKEYEVYANELFTSFINPFIDEFCDNLYIHEKSEIYKNISNLMTSFFEFERIYYGVSAPKDSRNIKVSKGLSRSEAARRLSNKQKKRSRGARDGV
ncbi:TorD/DmsD family molecular chaperone [Campylobacter geochelonis]|uniref:Putative formate dehydrogenase-specific chaperone n=1 Tax=Campylobacter geochelonis TaxID=1780362 RepID=A0A128EL89_9BACT|nr:molecular chaperone TorD family protein [Campylobacter geochelonis]QKF72027.1 putative formate dehydrogenase-specific chaperone [Campylobacter geochelonis]CZE46880.1 Putative formate dehydrogenase-specific chaperone [Campylobacter geochelonis]CZE49886.1 Putative formate dehydrogenase-specific chaperone [Campylobacter geochelonis]